LSGLKGSFPLPLDGLHLPFLTLRLPYRHIALTVLRNLMNPFAKLGPRLDLRLSLLLLLQLLLLLGLRLLLLLGLQLSLLLYLVLCPGLNSRRTLRYILSKRYQASANQNSR
jgi:hypothetical protein